MQNWTLAFVIGLALGLAACANPDALPRGSVAVPDYTPEEVEAMSTEEKIAVYNANAEGQDDELVCRRERAVGTHFRRTRCYTRAELREMEEAAQQSLGPEIRGPQGDPARIPPSARPL